MTSFATPGTSNVWFGAKGSTVMDWPTNVTSATSVAPRTPLQVASDSARTNEAVTRGTSPGSSTRSAKEASLLATPFAPLVMVDISVALRTPGIETVSRWFVCRPPLGGRSPVSDRGSGEYPHPEGENPGGMARETPQRPEIVSGAGGTVAGLRRDSARIRDEAVVARSYNVAWIRRRSRYRDRRWCFRIRRYSVERW